MNKRIEHNIHNVNNVIDISVLNYFLGDTILSIVDSI